MIARGFTGLRGLRETKTLQGSKKRSMPRLPSSASLEIFILEKEKDRLEKELLAAGKRQESLRRRLGAIAVEMRRLEAAKARDKKSASGSAGKPPKKSWKKMTLAY